MPTPPPWSGLTAADQAIIAQGCDMQIWPTPGPIDGFPSIDADGSIPFQFPPRITTDGKAAIWDETPLPGAYEPQALFMGDEARKIVLETQYVVTTKGSGWSTANIGQVLRLYKSYFYMTMGAPNPANMPLVRLKMYDYANDPQIFWRGKSVSIVPEGSLINDSGVILHLVHKVTMNLELITQVQGKTSAINKVAILPPTPKKTWY